MKNLYLKRYASGDRLINTPPEKSLGLIITIPAYNEDRLDDALKSINECIKPSFPVEVIVLINYPEDDDEEIINTSMSEFHRISALVNPWQSNNLKFHILLKALPGKHAGVGLARKIIMDEAVRRFEAIDNESGIITAFDADCTCEKNYLVALEEFFTQKPQANGCSIHFEHHKEERYSPRIYEAVYEYELHLRCYIDALRFCNVPHAFQTIGSSMAVKHKAYQQQGGMNKRKAGEDFYFLHRIIPLGEFGDLTTTTVYPSIRPSDRVPFGTGKAVNKWLETHKQFTYHPDSYIPLKGFINRIEELYNIEDQYVEQFLKELPTVMRNFLIKQGFLNELKRINSHSTSEKSFKKHFHQWFNGFIIMKYLHFARDNFFPVAPVRLAAEEIKSWLQNDNDNDNKDLLVWYRSFDRLNTRYIKQLNN